MKQSDEVYETNQKLSEDLALKCEALLQRFTIDTSRNRTRRILFIIFNFIEKVFLFQLMQKTL